MPEVLVGHRYAHPNLRCWPDLRSKSDPSPTDKGALAAEAGGFLQDEKEPAEAGGFLQDEKKLAEAGFSDSLKSERT
jgi:hypothetical protein